VIPTEYVLHILHLVVSETHVSKLLADEGIPLAKAVAEIVDPVKQKELIAKAVNSSCKEYLSLSCAC